MQPKVFRGPSGRHDRGATPCSHVTAGIVTLAPARKRHGSHCLSYKRSNDTTRTNCLPAPLIDALLLPFEFMPRTYRAGIRAPIWNARVPTPDPAGRQAQRTRQWRERGWREWLLVEGLGRNHLLMSTRPRPNGCVIRSRLLQL